MHIILGVLAVAAAVYMFVIRAKNTVDIAGDLLDAADNVRLAARRFGFRRRANVHPMDSFDDANVAKAAVVTSFFQMGSQPTQEQQTAMTRHMSNAFNMSAKDTEELVVLAHWLQNECGTASACLERGAKKAFKLEGGHAFGPTMAVIRDTLEETGGSLSDQQSEALVDIKNAFKIR